MIRNAKILIGLAVLGMTVSFGMADDTPPWETPCNGHNHSGAGTITKGDAIVVDVFMYAGSEEPEEDDWVNITEDSVSDLGCVCDNGKVYIKVKASDKDKHVCKSMDPPSREVSNYIKNSALSVDVESSDSAFTAEINLNSPEGDDDVFARSWTKTWAVPAAAAGKSLTFEFSGEVDDIHCNAFDRSYSGSSVKRDHRNSKDDTHNMEAYSANLDVLEIELEQKDDNSPIDPQNRICSNAQDKYMNVKYKVKISPDNYKADLEISGSADVTFPDGETEKENVSDGTEVTLVAEKETKGTWKLTAKSTDVEDCGAEVEEYVFKLFLKVGDADTSPGKTGYGETGNYFASHKCHTEHEDGICNCVGGQENAGDQNVKRFAWFVSIPADKYESYVKAKLKVTETFKDGGETGGLWVYDESLGDGDAGIGLNYGLISISKSQTDGDDAVSAFKGEIRIQGPNDENSESAPTAQSELRDSDITFGSFVADKTINTISEKTTYVNHYKVNDLSSRCTAESEVTTSGVVRGPNPGDCYLHGSTGNVELDDVVDVVVIGNMELTNQSEP